MTRSQPTHSRNLQHTQLLPGLHLFADTCNVYVVVDGDQSIAIDFGSGTWLEKARQLGLPAVSHVYLTHHHPDQCAGLAHTSLADCIVHAPAGEEAFYSQAGLNTINARGGDSWFPRESYSTLDQPLPAGLLKHDMKGFGDHYWRSRRLRFIHTPGHGRYAISIVLDHAGKQLVFCGDACHDGGTIHQPYHLEWDHWTGQGAREASLGVQRLADLGMDMLLPSHGPIITHQPRKQLQALVKKLDAMAASKGSHCPGEKDHYVTPSRFLDHDVLEIIPGLYWFHNGGYLLLSRTGEALITDPHGDLKQLDALLAQLPTIRITAQLVTHYHGDHMSAVDTVRQRFSAKLILHPAVAHMLARGGAHDVPFLINHSVFPDERWPRQGKWTWNEFTFDIAHMPGQTWWHCGFMTTINKHRVLFGGDTFQPASRWNGTGGYCSINGCRFIEGFAHTAQTILDWNPHIIVNGHGTWRYTTRAYFQKAIRWAHRTHNAIAALCPDGDLEKHYFLHPLQSFNAQDPSNV